jgi:beta-fructofuranosidase
VGLRLPDDWIWDAWFAVDGDTVHAFYLHAPRALGQPDRRHEHARIGHATSRDLRAWDVLEDALGPGGSGAFDEVATWTGSVIRRDGRWLMFYTGLPAGPRIQRVGLATSDDLDTWTKTDVVISADAEWYERSTDGSEEHWRDPWAFVGPDGEVHLLITARGKDGPSDGRGVIGHASSRDTRSWEVGPALSSPGAFAQLEVPQLVDLGRRWAVLFSARAGDHSAARLAVPAMVAESGTHFLLGDGPLGPFDVAPGRFLAGGPGGRFFAGRIVTFSGEHRLLGWVDQVDGRFVGELSDPMPVVLDPELGPRLAESGDS